MRSEVSPQGRIQIVERGDLVTLKSLNAPPHLIKIVVESALILLGFENLDNWAEMRKVLKQTNDLERALNLFSADKVSSEAIERVAPFVTSPEFNIHSIRCKSSAAASLGQWVIDIIYAAASINQNNAALNTSPPATRAGAEYTRPVTAQPKRVVRKPKVVK